MITVVAAAATVLLSKSTFPSPDEWVWWLAVLPVAMLHPIVVTRGSRTIGIGLDPVVIIFLAFAAPGHALVLWTAGSALAQVRRPAPHSARTAPSGFHHTTMNALAGAATVFVVTRRVPHAHGSGPWALLAGGSGAVTYLVVDRVLSAAPAASLGRGSIRDSWSPGLAVTLACSGAAALGYLGAVVVRTDPWALPLPLVPVGALMAAVRGHHDALRERARVAGLLTVAGRLDRAQTAQEVPVIVLDDGRLALRVGRLSLVTDRDEHAMRASVLTGSTPTWRAAEPRRGESFTSPDQRTLDPRAALASHAVRRLTLQAGLATHAALTGLPNRASLH